MPLTPVPGQSAWLVAANMGLGHLRAAYPLRDLSGNQIIIAGAPEYSSPKENKLWRQMRHLYEGISRINHIPLIGSFFFNMMDRLQQISPYYPFRDLSKATAQVMYMRRKIHQGLGKTMVEMIRPSGLPILSTFFTPAIAADEFGYDPVYLVVTDSDINRVWVPADPSKSNLIYLAPCGHAVYRLKEYGIPDNRIFLTGFPLPKENLGGPDLEILKLDLAQRLITLDPNDRFWSLHRVEVEHYLNPENCVPISHRPLTLTFAVGGAGAQKEIGVEILRSLKKKIQNRQIKLIIVAGIRPEVKAFFDEKIDKIGLSEQVGWGVSVLHSPKMDTYFQRFNLALRATDILWTKPSELSFYCGLGIPMIIAPPLGSHEHYNRKWIIEHRAGISQEDPLLCSEWLFDMLSEGRLAQAAWDGFLNMRKCGTYKIEELIRTGTIVREPSPLKR